MDLAFVDSLTQHFSDSDDIRTCWSPQLVIFVRRVWSYVSDLYTVIPQPCCSIYFLTSQLLTAKLNSHVTYADLDAGEFVAQCWVPKYLSVLVPTCLCTLVFWGNHHVTLLAVCAARLTCAWVLNVYETLRGHWNLRLNFPCSKPMLLHHFLQAGSHQLLLERDKIL